MPETRVIYVTVDELEPAVVVKQQELTVVKMCIV